MSRISANDFFSGLLAELSQVVPGDTLTLRNNRFDEVAGELFEELSKDDSVTLRFRVLPDPLHGDSETVRTALATAVQRDLISLDNPTFQDMRFKIDRTDARRIVESIDAPEGYFERAARRFYELYTSPDRSIGDVHATADGAREVHAGA